MRRLVPVLVALLAACATAPVAPEAPASPVRALLAAQRERAVPAPPPGPPAPPPEELYFPALSAAQRASLVNPAAGTTAEEIQLLLDRRARLVAEAVGLATQIAGNQPHQGRAFGHALIARVLEETAVALEQLGPVPGLPARIARLRSDGLASLRRCASFDEPLAIVQGCERALKEAPTSEERALGGAAASLAAAAALRCGSGASATAVVLQLEISPAGAVTAAKLAPPLDGSPAGQAACLLEQLRALRFERQGATEPLELVLPLSLPAVPPAPPAAPSP